MFKREWIAIFFLASLSLLILWPGLGATSTAWMGAVDGFVLVKARFFKEGLGLGSWNRYWFLGIPGQHVGSPVIAWVLSLFSTWFGLWGDPTKTFAMWRSIVALGVAGSVVGVFVFVRGLLVGGLKISDKRKKGVFSGKDELELDKLLVAGFVAMFVLLIPSLLTIFPQIWRVVSEFGWPSWMVFSPFYLGDGNKTIGFAALMIALVVGWRLVREWDLRRAVVLSFLVAAILLIDSLSLLTFVLWLVVLVLAVVVQPKLGSGSVVTLSARLIVICGLGLLLAGFWFTPGYVWTFLGSSSLGGQAFSRVAVNLFNRLLTFLPLIFGIIIARKWLKVSNPAVVIGVMGLLVFGSITLASFMADADFWQDYSRVGRSLDLSLALVVGGLLYGKSVSKQGWMVALSLIVIVSLPFLIGREKLLRGRVGLEGSAEYRVGKVLEDLVNESCGGLSDCGDRVYLSGSSVFWLNSWFDVAQVRGGGEQGSTHDWWPHGSYQIREGIDPEISKLWLEVLGVDYLVVHGSGSAEVYHDFKVPSKFEKMEGWEKVWEEKGDTIYSMSKSEGEVSGISNIARVVDLEILEVSAPEKGDDARALKRYVSYMKAPVRFEWKGEREVEVSTKVDGGQGVRLAVSYSPFWHIKESSLPVTIVKDSLGMMVLQPQQSGDLRIVLRFSPWLDIVAGLSLSGFGLFVVLRRPKFIERVADRVHRIFGRDTELDKTAL